MFSDAHPEIYYAEANYLNKSIFELVLSLELRVRKFSVFSLPVKMLIVSRVSFSVNSPEESDSQVNSTTRFIGLLSSAISCALSASDKFIALSNLCSFSSFSTWLFWKFTGLNVDS